MPDRARIDALTATANELVAEINTLNKGTGKRIETLSTKVLRSQRVLWAVVIGMVALVIGTLLMAITLISAQINSDRLDKLTQRLDYSQNVTRRQVLCPLYQIFVDSRSEQGRAAYPKGPAEYDRVFGVIEESYRVLNCQETKEG